MVPESDHGSGQPPKPWLESDSACLVCTSPLK